MPNPWRRVGLVVVFFAACVALSLRSIRPSSTSNPAELDARGARAAQGETDVQSPLQPVLRADDFPPPLPPAEVTPTTEPPDVGSVDVNDTLLPDNSATTMSPGRLPGTATVTVEGRSGWSSPLVARREYSDEIPEWPESEKERQSSVLGDLLRGLRATSLHEGSSDSGEFEVPWERDAQRRVRLLGLQSNLNEAPFACGRWNRFWVVVECAVRRSGTWSRCAGEYHTLDILVECPVAKVSVDRIYPVRAARADGKGLRTVIGLYEVQFYVRKCHPEYRVGVDLLAAFSPEWGSVMIGNGIDNFPRSSPIAHWASPAKVFYPASLTNASVAIVTGADIIPMNRACDSALHVPGRADRRDLFRYGAWVRLPNATCDGIHCDGTLQAWETDGWVWAPDLCRIQVYSVADTRAVLSDTRLFAWGASTLGQPLAILVEKLKRRRKRRRPANATLSAVDKPDAQLFDNGLEVNMNPARCYRFRNFSRPCMKQTYNPATDALGIDTWPMYREFRRSPRADLVLIEVTAWMADEVDVKSWMTRLRNWTESYAADLRSGAWTPAAAEVFHTPVAWENSMYVRHSGMINVYLQRLRSWLTEDYLTSKWPELFTVINRHDMTLPLHFGTQHVQGNHHYGATAKSCAQKLAQREGLPTAAAYAPEKCIRKVYADIALILAWLNLYSLARGGAASPPPVLPSWA